MSISQGRYVEVTADGSPVDPQAAADLAAAAQAGAIAGDIAGRAAGAEAGAAAGTEVAAGAGAAAGATAGEVAGAAAGTASGATAGAAAGGPAGAAAGAAAAGAVVALKANTNADNVAPQAAAWRTAIGAVGATELAASGGSALAGFLQAGTDAVARTAQSKLRDIYDVRDWGAVTNGTSQQSIVQAAIDDLAAVPYATLNIPNGVLFNSQTLGFAANHQIYLRYVRDCDAGAIGPYAGGTGEIIVSAITSEYPTDPTSGYVCENIFEGPLHPSVFVDARPDMTGAAAGFGPAQTPFNPARSTLGFRQERTNRFSSTWIYYGLAKSNFSGLFSRAYRQTYILSGVGSSAWVTPPAVDARVTSSGGASGYVVAIDASTLTVEWISGRFAVGQTLADDNETGIGPITISARQTIREMSPMAQSVHTGAWGINVAPGLAKSTWTVGGDMRARRWQTFGQYTPADQQVQWPGYVWENPSSGGASARQVSTESAKRVWMFDGETEAATARGMLGAVCASGRFTSALVIGATAINVESVAKAGTGLYTVTFRRPLASSSFITVASLDGFYGAGYVAGGTVETTTTVQLRVRDAAGTLADLPASATLHFIITGGDV